MQETRRINVYLPPAYDRCAAARYPVLYMPDGGIGEDFPHVASTVDRLARAGHIGPMIVVGVENTVRRRDMTGPTAVAEDLRVTGQPGGSGRFRNFVATELMPVVAARYRVTDEAGIIGESLAGLFIVETLFQSPGLFDTYIAIDPSLWWNAEAIAREAPQRLAEWDAGSALLLLTAGGRESNVVQVERLAEALRATPATGLRWNYLPRPDLRHDTIYRGTEAALLQTAFASRGGRSMSPGERESCPEPAP